MTRDDERRHGIEHEDGEAGKAVDHPVRRVVGRRAGRIAQAGIGDEDSRHEHAGRVEKEQGAGQDKTSAHDADREGGRERAPDKEVGDLDPAAVSGRQRAHVVAIPAVPGAGRALDEEGHDEQGRADDATEEQRSRRVHAGER